MRCSHFALTMSPAPGDLIQCKTTPAHHILSSRTPRNDVEAKNKGCYKNRPTLWNGGVKRKGMVHAWVGQIGADPLKCIVFQ